MNLKKSLIRIALVDICEFTKFGLEKLISFIEEGSDLDLNVSHFDSMNSLNESELNPDIVIFDPFFTLNITGEIEDSISLIKRKNEDVNIFVFSIAVGYVKPFSVDGMFNKKIPISDFVSLLKLTILKKSSCKVIIASPMTDTIDESLTFNNSEVFVLRGYSNNFKTKQIASFMGCDVKKVYYLKRKALEKIEIAKSLPHYNNIIRIFS